MVTNDSKINNARVMTMFMAIRNFECFGKEDGSEGQYRCSPEKL